MKKLTKRDVVLEWFLSGIKDFFLAFQIDNCEEIESCSSFSVWRYGMFINGMGLEKVCKSYMFASIPAKVWRKYENLEVNDAKSKLQKIARKWGHCLSDMIKEIKKSIGNQVMENILSQKFDGYIGKELIEVMEATYLEARYPDLPSPIFRKFPVEGHPGLYYDPTVSSGIGRLCYVLTCTIAASLKKDFDISIPEDKFRDIICGKAGERFLNSSRLEKILQ